MRDELGDASCTPGTEGDTMAFYLLRHDRSTGVVELLSPAVFDDRAQALTALRDIVAGENGRLADSCDVYAADLDDAQPVLWMSAPTTGEGVSGSQSEPRAGADAQLTPEPGPWWESPPIGIPTELAEATPQPATWSGQPGPSHSRAPWPASDRVPRAAAVTSAEACDEGLAPFTLVDESFAWAVADTAMAGTAPTAPVRAASDPRSAPGEPGATFSVRPPDPADAVAGMTSPEIDPPAERVDEADPMPESD